VKRTVTAAGPVKRVARSVLPSDRRGQLGRRVMKVVDRFGVRPEPMSAAVRLELRDYFRTPNDELADLLGMDFDSWNADA
jgi:hypothetical protein